MVTDRTLYYFNSYYFGGNVPCLTIRWFAMIWMMWRTSDVHKLESPQNTGGLMGGMAGLIRCAAESLQLKLIGRLTD